MKWAMYCVALLMCLTSCAAKAKLMTIDKKQLQQLSNVRKKDKKGLPTHSCGVVVQMLHPNMSNEDAVQIKDVAAKNRLSNALLSVKDEVKYIHSVAFAKFAYKKNKLWLEYHTEGIFHTDWDDVQVAFFEENTDVKGEMLTTMIEDVSGIGIARFLNKKCGSKIKEVRGETTERPKPKPKAEKPKAEL
jgi:hypothetical protein